MGHQSWTQRVHGAAAAIIGILVAVFTLTTDKGVDTVALYSFSHAISNTNALDEAIAATPTAATTSIALAAYQKITPMCIVPSIFKSNPMIRSPACQCAFSVLNMYNTATPGKPLSGWNNASRTKQNDFASRAFKACFDSQQSVPKTTFMWKDKYETTDINTRKVVSRGGLVLMIALSVIFTLVYNMIDFSTWTSFYMILSNVALVVLAGLQLFLPAIGGANVSNIISFFAILIVPAFVIEFVLVEFVWSYIYGRGRTAFVHPYVFVTTLSALFVMAAIENGVFSWNEIFSRILTAHSLSLAYAASIFFVHFGCGDWKKEGNDPVHRFGSDFSDSSKVDQQTLAGYFLLAFTVVAISGANFLPLYPTAPELSFIWFFPWYYVFVVFGTVVLVQNVGKGSQNAEERLHSLTYMGSLGGVMLVLAVFFFYLLRFLHLGYGDTFLSNSGGVLKSLNFALKQRMVGFPIGSTTPLYVVP